MYFGYYEKLTEGLVRSVFALGVTVGVVLMAVMFGIGSSCGGGL